MIEQFNDDQELIKYIPNDCRPSTVTREFLLSLLFNIRRDKYLSMYEKYKKAKINSGKVFEINKDNSFVQELNNYITAQ